jgi:hypothetical protein
MARVPTDRCETGSHPLPLATESPTAYRLVEREFGSAKLRSGSFSIELPDFNSRRTSASLRKARPRLLCRYVFDKTIEDELGHYAIP